VNELADDWVVCPHCNTENSRFTKHCWICHRQLLASKNSAAQAIKRQPSFTSSDRTFMLVALGLIVAIVMIVVGMWGQAPGFGIVILILFSPIILATLAGDLKRRRSKHGGLTGMDRILALFTSLLMTMTILMLLVVGGFVALLIMCAWPS